MGNGGQGETSSTIGYPSNRRLGLASIGAITGGSLLALDNIWQGYLDVTPGNDGILHDVTHYAYYLNNSMLFLAMCGLLLGLYGLHNRVTAANAGFMWRTGVFLSGIGQGSFAIGALAFILHGFFGFKSFMDLVNLAAGIGNIVMYLGALPLGLVLRRRNDFPRIAAMLFLLTVPAVAVAMIVIYSINPLVGGLLSGGLYGLAWIMSGFYLKK
ncbi:hypothetical protein A8F94_09490 [Bacillus sp. FJAT-27225]|uniref:hypothetical protein n=1 Tax=Bacillus sp. FJAT-27225 TaxID=1743144 RepID=UPI00080C2AFF|nr:hypothetical protein [Bacillus sp. FJAT-27225]OCA88045.1 hypothetical protein A8F94_09490 [Bacillus sp. FJAT-27225]